MPSTAGLDQVLHKLWNHVRARGFTLERQLSFKYGTLQISAFVSDLRVVGARKLTLSQKKSYRQILYRLRRFLSAVEFGLKLIRLFEIKINEKEQV